MTTPLMRAEQGRFAEPFSAYIEHDKTQCRSCHHWRERGACGLTELLSVRELLQRVYGEEIALGRCERGDSLVLRSELFLSGHTQARGAYRCHFTQQAGASHAGRSGGRYVGFAEIRPGSTGSEAPIAAAFLKIPLHFLRSQVHEFPLAWYYGSYSGVMPFIGTPYTMHNSEHGYLCAQACVYISLLMMARHGGRVFGPTTITAIARPKWPEDVKRLHRSRGFHEIPSNQTEDFDIHGLDALQIEEVARQAGLQPHREWLPPSEKRPLEPLVAQRMIAAYLAAGCPVILLVSIRQLHKRERDALRHRGIKPPEYSGDEHAVVVIGGSHLDSTDPTISTFVLHDTAVRPYIERSADEVVKACLAYGGRGEVEFVTFCPNSVFWSASQIWEISRVIEPAFGPDPRKLGRYWRLRLCEASLAHIRYFGEDSVYFPLGHDQMMPDVFVRQATALAASTGAPGEPESETGQLWLLESFRSADDMQRRQPETVIAYGAGENSDPRIPVFALHRHEERVLLGWAPDDDRKQWLRVTGGLSTW